LNQLRKRCLICDEKKKQDFMYQAHYATYVGQANIRGIDPRMAQFVCPYGHSFFVRLTKKECEELGLEE